MLAIVKLLGGWRATLFAVLGVAAVICFLVADARATRSRVRADAAEQRAEALAGQVKATEQTLGDERRAAEALAKIAEQYEKDKRDAEAAQERLVADLRAGTVQLQNRWRGCEATSAATASQLDAAARDREASAARIVRAARDADDQIRGLQKVILDDRSR